MIPRKGHKAEEIVAKLRQVEVLTSQGHPSLGAKPAHALTFNPDHPMGAGRRHCADRDNGHFGDLAVRHVVELA